MNKRRLGLAAAFAIAIAVLTVARFEVRGLATQGVKGGQAPVFQVDPMWPKPLPNNWIMGNVIGVAIDSKDHVWIIHRPAVLTNAKEMGSAQNPPLAVCCSAAPPVLEFDQAGNLLRHWGGKGEGYDWPQSEHGIFIDHKDNVWLGANGQQDSHILKFSQDGKLLLQLGKPGATPANGNSADTVNFGGVADFSEDAGANELYVADGYRNHRVVVIDIDTGKYKRHWGAYGKDKPITDTRIRYTPGQAPAQQFANPVHCAVVSNDGFVYVCDRVNDRYQVFRKDGTFVKEVFFMEKTLGDGSIWDVDFSRDAQQRFLYTPDGANQRIHIFQRDIMAHLKSFGGGGRYPGLFYAVHSLATDSKGNVFTTETYEGKRVQKFVYKGLGAVTSNSLD